MTYSGYEASVQDGRPFWLYQFDNGVTIERYTSGPQAVTFLSETWEPLPISHSDIEQSGNIEKQAVELNMPISEEFARSFLIPIAARITTVTLFRSHIGDVDAGYGVEWKGRVLGTRAVGKRISIMLESVFTSMKQSGCRARYQLTCRHAVYFGGCRLVKADWEVPVLVTAVNGLVLTLQIPASSVSSFPNDWVAGIVDFNGLYGFVQSQTSNTVTLLQPIYGLAEAVEEAGETESEGVLVMIAPGCRLTREYCQLRFDNHLNFGGFPYIPNANPFVSNIA